MTNDQALLLASILIDAVRKAVASGSATIDFIADLQAADDAAREELETIIAEIEATIGNRG